MTIKTADCGVHLVWNRGSLVRSPFSQAFSHTELTSKTNYSQGNQIDYQDHGLVPCTSCGTETVWFESPTPLHTKNEPNTIPSLGIYPFTVTTFIEGHGLCTNGHGYLATLARSNRIGRPVTIPYLPFLVNPVAN